MEAIAAWLGTILGAALKQCAPVLRDILRDAIREAMTPTVEDGKRDPELKERLSRKIRGGK